MNKLSTQAQKNLISICCAAVITVSLFFIYSGFVLNPGKIAFEDSIKLSREKGTISTCGSDSGDLALISLPNGTLFVAGKAPYTVSITGYKAISRIEKTDTAGEFKITRTPTSIFAFGTIRISQDPDNAKAVIIDTTSSNFSVKQGIYRCDIYRPSAILEGLEPFEFKGV